MCVTATIITHSGALELEHKLFIQRNLLGSKAQTSVSTNIVRRLYDVCGRQLGWEDARTKSVSTHAWEDLYRIHVGAKIAANKTSQASQADQISQASQTNQSNQNSRTKQSNQAKQSNQIRQVNQASQGSQVKPTKQSQPSQPNQPSQTNKPTKPAKPSPSSKVSEISQVSQISTHCQPNQDWIGLVGQAGQPRSSSQQANQRSQRCITSSHRPATFSHGKLQDQAIKSNPNKSISWQAPTPMKLFFRYPVDHQLASKRKL